MIDSVFSIRFRVDGSAGHFELSGSMLNASIFFDSGDYVRLTNASGTIYESVPVFDPDCPCYEVPTYFSGSGSLGPGEYELQAHPQANGGGDAHVDMTFSITDNVPEPTTAALLGSGLVGMLLYGRSHRSQP